MPAQIKRSILIGADPELFLVKNGKYVSAHDLLPGTKEKPFEVDHGAVQVDGVAAEFNITPSKSAGDFVGRCKAVMKTLSGMVVDKGITISIEPTATFDQDYWDKSIPDEPKKLGCNPDWNAWTETFNPAPQPPRGSTMRTASGHIHISWTKGRDPEDRDHITDCCILARQLDVFLGAPSLIWDADPKRRTLYGRAGAFRPKPYGIEYRTLSNKWLVNDSLMGYVYSNAYNCINGLLNGGTLFEEKNKDFVRGVIDGSVKWWEQKNNPIQRFLADHGIGIDTPLKYIDSTWTNVKQLEVQDDPWELKTIGTKKRIKKVSPTYSYSRYMPNTLDEASNF